LVSPRDVPSTGNSGFDIRFPENEPPEETGCLGWARVCCSRFIVLDEAGFSVVEVALGLSLNKRSRLVTPEVEEPSFAD